MGIETAWELRADVFVYTGMGIESGCAPALDSTEHTAHLRAKYTSTSSTSVML